ncbi:Hsp20/alpha crystallin family protein [Tessaracoccus flavus]|uniref:Heat-shock protein Hsp20 n=1 Tax=Tessaracoccus flavus TaxID=1610493 RepID=A0A1Q2CIF7_9ACTN|nr:Hsp20/alpha crystallin family protein [Tessaracoccus flavus]AQP45916.1 heat-shock protein Hsp20 [Tessaracoccus flavus]SDZ05739.1 heat shock protein Hsp20 [Tessaracoccus flavus]
MARTFDPFREMDRLFSDVSRSAATSLDLYRTGEKFVAEIDLPGVDPSSIDIDIEERTLTVRAERKSRTDSGEDTKWLVRERPNGTFARQLNLGYGLAVDKIEAEYSDGVLTLTIPVAEEARPRKVSVTHKGGQHEITGEVAPDDESGE